MSGRTSEGEALTALVLPVFELNGEFLGAAALISAPHGLTPAQWQVLGATWEVPLPVAEIARRVGLGLARQSVQRVANNVVQLGWATWQENPNHQRAKLLAPTPEGRAAVASMATEQHAWANSVGAALGTEQLHHLHSLIGRVIAASVEYRERAARSE